MPLDALFKYLHHALWDSFHLVLQRRIHTTDISILNSYFISSIDPPPTEVTNKSASSMVSHTHPISFTKITVPKLLWMTKVFCKLTEAEVIKANVSCESFLNYSPNRITVTKTTETHARNLKTGQSDFQKTDIQKVLTWRFQPKQKILGNHLERLITERP